jgi:hypothetical protein
MTQTLPLERDTAMRAALAHADREVKRWSDLAYLFLADFAAGVSASSPART